MVHPPSQGLRPPNNSPVSFLVELGNFCLVRRDDTISRGLRGLRPLESLVFTFSKAFLSHGTGIVSFYIVIT